MLSHVTFWGKLESCEHRVSWWLTFLSLLFLIPISRVGETKAMFHTSGTFPHHLESFLLCSHTACVFVETLSLLRCHLSREPLLWIPLVEQCPFFCHWLSTYSTQYFFKAFNISWNECFMQARFFTVVFNSYYFMHVDILCKYISVHHVQVCSQVRPGEGIRCTGTGFTEDF